MSDEKHYCAAAEMSDTAWEAEKKTLDAMGIDGCPPPPTDPEDEKLFQQNLKKIAEEKKDNIPW